MLHKHIFAWVGTFLIAVSCMCCAAVQENKEMSYQIIDIEAKYLRSYQIQYFLENIDDIDYIKQIPEGHSQLAINFQTGEYFRDVTQNKYFKLNLEDVEYNIENFEILSDEQNIRDFLVQSGVENIQNYYLLILPNVLDGYLLLIQTDSSLNFIPLLWYGNSYAEFKDKQVYSTEEFLTFCAPRECSLEILEKNIECDVKPVMYAGTVTYPLRAILEAIGEEVIWQQTESSVVFGNYKLMLKEQGKAYLSDSDTGYVGDRIGTYVMQNDRTMVNEWLIRYILNSYKLDVQNDWDTKTIQIYSSESIQSPC